MQNNSYTTPQKKSFSDQKLHPNLMSTTPKTIGPRGSSEKTAIYEDNNAKISVNYMHRKNDSTSKISVQDPKQHQQYNRTSSHFRQNNIYAINSQPRAPNRQDYFKFSEVELKNLLIEYEMKIRSLKSYIQKKQLEVENRIINHTHTREFICDGEQRSEQNKVVLRQLSSRVRGLIKQNQRLNSRGKQAATNQQELRLLNQNQKLKYIIEEYKANEISDNEKLNIQVSRLRKQNEQLLLSHKKPIHPLRTNRSPGNSKEKMENIKNHLTKTIYDCSQKLQRNNQQQKLRINELERLILNLEKTIAQYKRERQIKISSTIRKSFTMSQSIKRLAGDQQNVTQQQQMIKGLQESFQKPQKMFTFSRIENSSNRIQTSKEKDFDFKLFQNKIAILEMRNRDLEKDKISLIKQLQANDIRINDKISQILQLQKQLMNIRSEIQRIPQKQQIRIIEKQICDPIIQKQVQMIRQLLQSCNITNYDLFFKQFSEIVKQRDSMQNQINHYQIISDKKLFTKRSKQQTDALNKKIEELTQQNKILINKVAELEAEVDRYHSEVLAEEINKLTQLSLKDHVLPSGKQAIEWQKIVKSCIENSVVRLSAIQTRMMNNQTIIHSNLSDPVKHENNKIKLTLTGKI